MNFKEEILKSIETAIDKKLGDYRVDCTYQSVIKEITPKGYVILDRAGSERTVKCCIPGVTLQKFQRVWVKEPMGDLKGIHICGVAGK